MRHGKLSSGATPLANTDPASPLALTPALALAVDHSRALDRANGPFLCATNQSTAPRPPQRPSWLLICMGPKKALVVVLALPSSSLLVRKPLALEFGGSQRHKSTIQSIGYTKATVCLAVSAFCCCCCRRHRCHRRRGRWQLGPTEPA